MTHANHPTITGNDRRVWLLVALVLATFVGISVYTISVKSITNDELAHIPAGYSYLKTFDFRMNSEHPPLIKELAAIPLLFVNAYLPLEHESWNDTLEWEFGAQTLYFQNSNSDQIIFWARVPMILLGVLLGIYIFLFGRALYGPIAGIAALALYSFCPNVLAHTSLVTTDVGLALFSTMTLYHYWKYLDGAQRKDLMLAAVGFGLAMAAKFSAVYLGPILALIAIAHELSQRHSRTQHATQRVKELALIASIGALVILLSYGIVHIDKYIEGLIEVAAHSQRGHNAYLMGEFSSQGFFWYFPIAMLLKTPIALFVMLGLVIGFYQKTHHDIRASIYKDSILLIPIAVFLGAFMLNNINIGLRHVLPIYPLLFIFASQAVNLSWKRWTKIAVIGGLLMWYIVSTALVVPDQIAYFNEFAGGPENGYKYLIDSNLDWGQDLKQLGWYLDEHGIGSVKMAYFGKDSRAYRGITWEELKCAPESGVLAVSVNRLVGLDAESSECLEWLRGFEPIAKIGYSIFVYNLSEEDVRPAQAQHCDTQCKKKCEAELQAFAGSLYNQSCRCRCNPVT
ncbi:MAG TPA: glycosyltransferase family 39 protein [Candidatus Nanoarchaeia archaeon]|nr:glycosyltransferase family 39 protein [Candidatus Nanoarchaeia archaeon]